MTDDATAEAPAPAVDPGDAVDPADAAMLRAAYAAFNARDADAVLARMTADVRWPRAFKGGFVTGPDAVRAYWAEQWGELDGRVEPLALRPAGPGRVLVEVHQVVRDPAGALLADDRVGHLFTLAGGLIRSMEIVPAPEAGSDP